MSKMSVNVVDVRMNVRYNAENEQRGNRKWKVTKKDGNMESY